MLTNSFTGIESGIHQFATLTKNVEDGKKFYANLTEKVAKLHSLIDGKRLEACFLGGLQSYAILGHCLSRNLMSQELEQNMIQQVGANNFNTNPGHQLGYQMPVTSPHAGQVYNNPLAYVPPTSGGANAPAAGSPQVGFGMAGQQPQYQQMQTTPQPNMMAGGGNAHAVSNPAPTMNATNPPAATGGSLLEEMKQAQLAAENAGQLQQFTGMPATNNPAPTPQDDLAAAATGR